MQRHNWFFKQKDKKNLLDNLSIQKSKQLSDSQKLKLVQKLQVSLNPLTVFYLYTEFIYQHFGFKGVKVELQDESFVIGQYQNLVSEHQFTITLKNKKVGMLYFSTQLAFSSEELDILTKLNKLLSQPLFNAIEHQNLQEVARSDALTGLNNRYRFKEVMRQKLTCMQTSVSLMILDLDDFKKVNDTYGHSVGDIVLNEFAQILKQCTRKQDHIFRLGGDEFTLLIEHVCNHDAINIAHRIKEHMEQHTVMKKYRVSCCIGATSLGEERDATHVFNQADKALYRAKNTDKGAIELPIFHS